MNLMPMEPLHFNQFTVHNRCYYLADFTLTKNQSNTLHTHDFYEILVILDGTFIEHTNGQCLKLHQHMVHFIKPSDTHFLSTASQYSSNTLRNIALDADFFKECLDELGLTHTDALFTPFELDELAYSHYHSKVSLLLQFNHPEQTNRFLIKSILSDLMIYHLLAQSKDQDIPPWLKNAYNEMYKKDHYTIGLPRLIELSGKSQEHLTRSFKKFYRITPSDHINNIRLQAVASMLTSSDKKIIDIMFECGFENISYFNRSFKKKFGVTPRTYQENAKNFFHISK